MTNEESMARKALGGDADALVALIETVIARRMSEIATTSNQRSTDTRMTERDEEAVIRRIVRSEMHDR